MLLALAQGTPQDAGSHLLSELAKQSRPSLVLGITGLHVLRLVFLIVSADHLSQGYNSRAIAGRKGPHLHQFVLHKVLGKNSTP